MDWRPGCGWQAIRDFRTGSSQGYPLPLLLPSQAPRGGINWRMQSDPPPTCCPWTHLEVNYRCRGLWISTNFGELWAIMKKPLNFPLKSDRDARLFWCLDNIDEWTEMGSDFGRGEWGGDMVERRGQLSPAVCHSIWDNAEENNVDDKS